MKPKKIIMIIVLIVFIGVVGFLLYSMNEQNNKKLNNANNPTLSGYSDENNDSSEYVMKQLDDGVLYSIGGKEYTSDIVIGDNYFDTTINDIYLNSDTYKDKIIEIEGMYLENLPYVFVGRYAASSLCAYCPPGYSYLEYSLKGPIDRKFTEKEDWIKIKGTLAKGNDATTNYKDYYYLEVLSLEVMNNRGQETIKN